MTALPPHGFLRRDGAPHGWAAVHDGIVYGMGADPDTAEREASEFGAPPGTDVYPMSAELAARAASGANAACIEDGLALAPGETSPSERLAAFAAEVAGAEVESLQTASWIDERRRMMARLARAYAEGDPTVGASPRSGRIGWTRAAPHVADGWGDGQRIARLSHAREWAAEEVAQNLGDRTFLDRLAVERRNREEANRELMQRAGTALFGEQWVSPLARAIEINVRTAQRWAAGEWPVDPERLRPLATLIPSRRAELRRALAELDAVEADLG